MVSSFEAGKRMDSGMYPVLLTEKSYELKRKKREKKGLYWRLFVRQTRG